MEDIEGRIEEVEKAIKSKEKELGEANEGGKIAFLRHGITALRQEKIQLLKAQLLDKKLLLGLSSSACAYAGATQHQLSEVPCRQVLSLPSHTCSPKTPARASTFSAEDILTI